ncbi:MAG: hypothetical protein ABJB47_02550 [Actinomycetota bacterium]
MKTATGLTLVAIGAILAFAVKAHPSFLNLQIAGWVIIIVGLAGLLVPQRGYGWLRRRVVVRRSSPRSRPVARVEETRAPGYVMLEPVGPVDEAEATAAPAPGHAAAPAPGSPEDVGEILTPPQTEVVEEYFEE